jgi:hypothetical protein
LPIYICDNFPVRLAFFPSFLRVVFPCLFYNVVVVCRIQYVLGEF